MSGTARGAQEAAVSNCSPIFSLMRVRFGGRTLFLDQMPIVTGDPFMRAPHTISLLSLLALAACSADRPAADLSAPAAEAVTEVATPGADTPTETKTWSREEVEFAFKCHGVITAATAGRTILPEAERPDALNRLTMGTGTKWMAEAFSRADAAGLSQAEQNDLMSSTTRVLATREALEAVIPDIEACLAEIS